MAVHLHRDLERIKKELLLLGSLVEDLTVRSIVALKERRAGLAEEVDLGDKEVDEREIRLEEECLKLLALHQPVANDLRFVVTVMKVNNDLERVGDLAGNLANRAEFLAQREPVKIPDEILAMGDRVPGMLRHSLDALIAQDTKKARQVLDEDEFVDETHKSVFRVIEDRIREHPDKVSEWIQLLSVSRYLERIADLATNIAEDVVFLVDAEVVRHRRW